MQSEASPASLERKTLELINVTMCTKHISQQDQRWLVSTELEQEMIKLASYDTKLVEIIWDVRWKRILDYGCGTWALCYELLQQWADVYGYDISTDMITSTIAKIWRERTLSQLSFDNN